MTNSFRSIHPFDQHVIAEYPLMDAKAVDTVLMHSADAFKHWRRTSMQLRADLLLRLAVVLRENKDVYAKIISLEMGKLFKEAQGEVEKCAWNCVYYAENGAAMINPEPAPADGSESYVVFEPIGAVFAIMPWNFPFWQVFRFAAPVLLGGNTIILKHAPNVTGCAIAMQQIFLDAGFPEHVFQTVVIDVDLVENIIAHDIVQGVTLTGSERAGSAVASLAGKHLKKTVLELGGSDALIVLNDADVNLAAKVALQSRFQNAGQSCIASKRFIVEEKIRPDFIQALINGISAMKQGDPFNADTTMGPMARMDLAAQLESQLQISLRKGAGLLAGGARKGANFLPSVLDHVEKGMPAFDEELFGPIAAVISAANADEAIAMANDSRYGLGASIFTQDIDKAKHYARQIESGSVFVNALVKSDPRIPFGGIKRSGYGRELSHFGMKEFMNIKTIYIA
ncbi:MAG TPA: NAD-dependent succinate-semialdehyde dehydrogenase [Chitinophagales bacterium]|nr:NAD-dependent succinate-semialdehyde dehydrogenase [Chitinophagales bacterium]